MQTQSREVGVAAGVVPKRAQTATSVYFALSPLPYAEDALEPGISANTLRIHYHKHKTGYADTLNKLVPGTPFADLALEEVVRATAGKPEHAEIFDNAAQTWNHAFYWRSLNPKGGGPSAALKARIDSAFGDVETLKQELATAATTQFGSGWAWLLLPRTKLRVVKTGNADTPLTEPMQPLLTIGLWEHAYYLDFQNRRPAYVSGVLGKPINWEFVSENLASE